MSPPPWPRTLGACRPCSPSSGRDENLTYWSRLMAAGVPVECHVFPGCYHCFELSVPEAEVSKQAYELTYAALRRAFSKG